jgi:AcrR family transcriptional regulator
MARSIPEDRLQRLVEAATTVFIEQGFRHTRMEDVAEVLGIAKGTLYLYVESKEALFDLACRAADRPFEPPKDLPVRSPAPGATLRYIGERLAAGQVMPSLGAALAGPSLPTIDELAAIAGDIYDALARSKVGIKLVDRSARDIPELGKLWFGGARTFLVDALSHYLADRIKRGYLRSALDVPIAARFMVETCSFWAVHRHWDSAKQDLSEERARAAVIDLVGAALIDPTQSRKARRGKEPKK